MEGHAPGLYIHVPFCRRKCRYCDFVSTPRLALIPRWLAGLREEITRYGDLGLQFDSLYLGGGTPSLLPLEALTQLLDHLFAAFSFSEGLEFTLEANPEDLTLEVLKEYQRLGVNRLSVGLQSLWDRELAFLGRGHRAARGLEALELARRAGCGNLSVDLIYGLPGQSLADWRHTLEGVLALAPEHLSCYQLTLEEGTPLARERARGRLELPGEEEQRRFFLFTAEFLGSRGYVHYEVSNFARKEAYICRHNVKYWTRAPYLGLGPAAHSFLGDRRFWNHPHLEAYLAALEAGAFPVAGEETLTREQQQLEAVFLGLRTARGLPLALLREIPLNQAALRELLKAGLLKQTGDRLVPTLRGLVVAEHLALSLLG